ncbi:MAG: (Fe-S)-binding protein [Deltaproteobacteria bacterium]|nr:(Fe-S)-binding protein [Deltaproteobacteria bacterium]
MANQDYHFTEIITLDACSSCSLCADVCPAVLATGDGKLSGFYRLHLLKKLQRSRSGWLAKLFKKYRMTDEELAQFGETVFKCTLCGNCQEVCPLGIRLTDIWVSLRQDLVHSSAYPRKVDMIGENISGSHNVFDEDNEERADWVDDMQDAPDDGFIKDRAEVVYFTGCVSAYFPMAQQIPIALARVFQAAGVDFTLLGEDEWCCGFPLLGAGLREMSQEVIDHNVAVIKAKGAKTIVFACPSCYQMWREYYPPEFRLTHFTEYVFDLVRAGRVPLQELPLTVTYHDPCDLGRGARVYEKPRQVIRSLPGVKLVEMTRNREKCACCGGGGNLEMIDKDLSAAIAKEKVEEALATGAEAIVTACQQCVRTMNTYVKRNKIQLEVLDITQLIERALVETEE